MMQAVPSLVGTGTAVAAATAGLIFGQAFDPDARPPTFFPPDFTTGGDGSRDQVLPSRLGTSTAANVSLADDFPYGSFRQFNGSNSGLFSHPSTNLTRSSRTSSAHNPFQSMERRRSSIKQVNLPARPVAETGRDSVSSRDSWYRRFSIRPRSQHGSPRSSLGPDSPVNAVSIGSGAPMLPSLEPAPQLSPNKLVKRGASGQSRGSWACATSRRDSKTQIPTLRRPATSHQRSATLQQFRNSGGFEDPPAALSEPQDHRALRTLPPLETAAAVERKRYRAWTSFFHLQVTRVPIRYYILSPGRPIKEDGSGGFGMPSRRVLLRDGLHYRAFLMKPGASPSGQDLADAVGWANGGNDRAESPQGSRDQTDLPEATSSMNARRSISTHFGSPTCWIGRNGSNRRAQMSPSEVQHEGKRHVSAPARDSQDSIAQNEVNPKPDKVNLLAHRHPGIEAPGGLQPVVRPRNSSSPLPFVDQLSRSKDKADIARFAMPIPLSSPSHWPFAATASPTQGQQAFVAGHSTRTVSGGRSSTLASSESRTAVSIDDDDIDFKSDTFFDSFRTVASSSRQGMVETPLELMFDESPSSTSGNSRTTKRLSIKAILGRTWDGETKIMEEDESLSTPIRVARGEDDELELERSMPDLISDKKEVGRLSMDDNDDCDWTRDDEDALSNHFSPPCSDVHSRGGSSTIFHESSTRFNGSHYNADGPTSPSVSLAERTLTISERPRSTVFDWCESSAHENHENGGHSPRPKTVHGKQEMDLRGGRHANRKASGAVHVRSQSVPVVPEPSDASKSVPKFGTWGMGTKTASEDWDDDFEFEESGAAPETGCKDSATSFSMVVPASIQATQPSVRAHSGQIRELSLLVNDLKRLCRYGKDLDILNGPACSKFSEAEDIIALASPDEDEDDALLAVDEMDTDTDGTSLSFASSIVDERFLDEGFEGAALDYTHDSFPLGDANMSRNAVVRERHTNRRRSVFSPEDNIFGGNWPIVDDTPRITRPHTPESQHPLSSKRSSAVISTVIEAMQLQRATTSSVRNRSPVKPSKSKLFFDTNSLQELVKRAGQLRDLLSDVVRRAELLTRSPAGTPRRERQSRNVDGSPAFTRVFTEPTTATTPPKRMSKSHSTNNVLTRGSIESPRMHMMTVS